MKVELPKEEVELNRCLPCETCGEKPVLTLVEHSRHYLLNCPNKCRAPFYLFIDNPENKWYKSKEERLTSCRKSWNRYQRRSDIDGFSEDNDYGPAIKQSREVVIPESPVELRKFVENEVFYKAYYTGMYVRRTKQASAYKAHAYKLGKLLKKKKQRIQELQSEIQKLKARNNSLADELSERYENEDITDCFN